MKEDEIQRAQEDEELAILDALARVTVGLGGKDEARILALALGPRFRDDNARREDV